MIVIVRIFANNTDTGKQRLQTTVQEIRRERDELLSRSIFFDSNVRRSANIKPNQSTDVNIITQYKTNEINNENN